MGKMDQKAFLVPKIAADQVEAAARPLPGVQPVKGPWIRVDAAYSAQMDEKARLLAERRDDVLAMTPGSEAACAEALEVVLAECGERDDIEVTAQHIVRPDGRMIARDGPPLEVLAQVVQEDICIMARTGGDEHVLIAACLCFPASWTLAEKIGRPLVRIHKPVDGYEDVAARVQRLFDGVQVGRPLWRANLHAYAEPTLFHPRREDDPRRPTDIAPYLRSERQTILRLPRTGAVIFAIHTSVAWAG